MMSTLEAVKLMLGIHQTSEQDIELQLMIEDAKASVRDYCNRRDFPEGAEYIVRELVIGKVKAENDVASIKMGDTEISYISPISPSSFSSKQMAALSRYKKIRMD